MRFPWGEPGPYWPSSRKQKRQRMAAEVATGVDVRGLLTRGGLKGAAQICLSRCAQRKKRSSQASWKTCCLGTPFPRSALFLLNSLWKCGIVHKSTEGLCLKVTPACYCSFNRFCCAAPGLRLLARGCVCGVRGRFMARIESSMRLSAPVLRISLPT